MEFNGSRTLTGEGAAFISPRLNNPVLPVEFAEQTPRQFRFAELPAHGSRLTAHGSRLTAHGSRLTAHGSRLTAHGSRLTAHGSRLYSIKKT
ncbi:MAG: hypothetical protein LBB98_03280, partial [Treponema sp.]|nr:hypothetical protein [Treponema sp.]